MGYVPAYDYNEHEKYDMEPIVTDLVSLPEAVQASAVEVIREIVADEGSYDFNVSGGHVFERKGEISSDQLAGHRNSSYGSVGDDVVLQITVRVRPDRPNVTTLLQETAQARIDEFEAEQQAKRREVEAELAALDAKRAELEQRRDALTSGRR